MTIRDAPKDMYGKLMTRRGSLVSQYVALCTGSSSKEVESLNKKLSPRDLKARLAREVTALYHTETKARAAEKEFVRVFQKKQLPSRIQKAKVRSKASRPLYKAVAELFPVSGAEARRAIEQGGVKIDSVVQKDPNLIF